MKILIINAGSSSYKLALYDVNTSVLAEPQKPLWQGCYQYSAHEGNGHVTAWQRGQKILDQAVSDTEHADTLSMLLNSIALDNGPGTHSLAAIDIVGHRVVHGGSVFQQPTVITTKVKTSLQALIPLAPLHLPANLKGMALAETLLPKALQVAIFDTAFHATLSEVASTYAGPYAWRKQGIQRYGFHGISYQYCAARCAAVLDRELTHMKIICCHLGNGASMAAIDQGKSVDTTMGFTPNDGLMMGSRCGSLDSGILLFLEQHDHQTAEELMHTLNFDAGLKGISGASNDMREIVRLCNQGNERAKLAYDMYIHSMKRNLGAMLGVLGGMDALVFTGGIGENLPALRMEVCQAFRASGVKLDAAKNVQCQPDALISETSSNVAVLVIATQEDWCMACTLSSMASQKI